MEGFKPVVEDEAKTRRQSQKCGYRKCRGTTAPKSYTEGGTVAVMPQTGV